MKICAINSLEIEILTFLNNKLLILECLKSVPGTFVNKTLFLLLKSYYKGF
jgi:hypothetical protein